MRRISECVPARVWPLATCATALFIWLLCQSCVQSDPQCPMVRYDCQSTGRADGCVYDHSFVWSLGFNSPTTPVIGSDGTLYFGTTGQRFYACSSQGAIQWMYQTDANITANSALAPDGTVYVGITGQLVALTTGGVEKWASPFKFTPTSSPSTIMVDSGGTVYFGADDKRVYAVNPDGTLKWSYLTGGTVRYGLSMSPDSSTVYATSGDGRQYAINSSDGTLKWRSGVISAVYNCAVGDDGTVYIGSLTGLLHAYAPDGTHKWAFQMQSKATCAPAVTRDGTIIVGSQDLNLYALDPAGHLQWRYRTGGPIYSAPTIDGLGNVIFGAWPGTLVSLDPTNGLLEWTQSLGSSIYAPPLVDGEGSIYTVCTDGSITKFDANPEPSSMCAMGALLLVLAGRTYVRGHRRRRL